MDYDEKIEHLKEKRIACKMTQEQLAAYIGVGRTYLAKIENGKERASEKLILAMEQCLERYNPENPLEILFDYVRIRFPTTDVRKVIEDIMRLRIEYMLHEEHSFYGYSEQCVLGDITVMFSLDEEKGVLMELKGKGCRQFEQYLAGQNRTWFDFLRQVIAAGGIFKRIDLAINDKIGMLNIPELIAKCENDECISVFRTFKDYRSGELVRAKEENKLEMGNTLYLGSMKSEVYFCVYEKDYEQYIRNGTPVEDAEIKNRFELRLKNDRAKHAVEDLLEHEDAGKTVFSIINRYVRFVDKREGKRSSEWEMSAKWKAFVSHEDRKLRLTTAPEPYTLDKTKRWMGHQVAPSFKVLLILDELKGTNVISNMIDNTKLKKRHEKLIEQQMAEIEDIII